MLDNENRNCNCGYMMNNNSNMTVENLDFPNTDALSANTSGMSCGNCCGMQGMAPKLPVYSYKFTNIGPEETCLEKEITREEMIEKIRCLSFAIVELAEYLDTHVDDEKAICLHKEYAKELRDLKDKYQKIYGPLTINFPCNKWRWIEEPWPWERGNF
ncbi:MAG: spore coat protein CotJB [Clostridiaceae bacterium]|nr:spore coat protein CotJB [Clostridiaceae bacterium]